MSTEVGASHEQKSKEEACKTYVEQIKQLITLASAFIFAPAAVQIFLQLKISESLVFAELLFVASVLAGYIALGAIAGAQFNGSFDMYRPAAQRSGKIQFFAYLAGLILFMYWFSTQPPRPPSQTSPATQGIIQPGVNNQNQGAAKATGEQNTPTPTPGPTTNPKNANRRAEQPPTQNKASGNR